MTTTTTGTTTGPATDPQPEPEAPVRINPRIRERRIEVIREAGRRRLRVLLVVSIVLCTAGLAYLVVTSPVLDVDRITVTGAQHVTMAQIRAASGIRVHDHLVFTDAGAAARRVEQLPWVERATVQRDFPGTVKIRIHEYIPVAYVRVGGGVLLVAANGHVIAKAPAAPAGTVEVRGVRRAPNVGELLSPPDAAGIVRALPAALVPRVKAVDVGGDGIALDVTGGGQIRLGDAQDVAAKGVSALAVMGHLGTACYSYIDVSTPARPTSHECGGAPHD